MAFKFKDLLSPESRQRIADRTAEAHRIYALSDKELGEEILSLARQARAENPELLATSEGGTYPPNMVWHVLPEVARRLGAEIAPDEAQLERVSGKQGQAFRYVVGSYIQNSMLWYGKKGLPGDEGGPLTAIEMLDLEVVHGNPAAVALDRICPPVPGDREDWVASRVAEIARYRGYDGPPMWTPEFDKASSNRAPTEAVDDEPAGLMPGM